MDFHYRPGLKLYSTNTGLISEARSLKDKYLNYIELYVIPGSYDKTISEWKEIDVPYVIHAPHSFHGVNIACPEYRETNIRYIREVQDFAEALDADTIIVHGGNNGNINETIAQLKLIDDPHVVVENKPKIGVFDESCIGWSPSEFNRLRKEGVLRGIVLDFTHAVCAARTAGIDEWELIRSLSEFNPKIFHLSDIDSLSHKDIHLNFGKGSMDLGRLLTYVPAGGFVTIETPRKISENLSEYIQDVEYLRNLLLHGN